MPSHLMTDCSSSVAVTVQTARGPQELGGDEVVLLSQGPGGVQQICRSRSTGDDRHLHRHGAGVGVEHTRRLLVISDRRGRCLLERTMVQVDPGRDVEAEPGGSPISAYNIDRVIEQRRAEFEGRAQGYRQARAARVGNGRPPAGAPVRSPRAFRSLRPLRWIYPASAARCRSARSAMSSMMRSIS